MTNAQQHTVLPMAERLPHQGYVIRSSLGLLLRQAMEVKNCDLLEGEWDFEYAIVLRSDGQAHIHGIAYGQRIIDEKVLESKAG